MTGCAVQLGKVTDSETRRLGITQTAVGKYVVCELCPTKTPKTPYRPTQRGTAVTGSLPSMAGTPLVGNPSVSLAAITSNQPEAVERMNQRPGEESGVTSGADDDEKRPSETLMPLLTLRFPFDVARIQVEHKHELAEFAANVWPTLPIKSLVVSGHTDDIGPQAYNDSLALKRAENVAAVLRDLGIQEVRVEGKGRCCYVANNDTPQGRAKNRRAEIHLFTNPR
jgi:Outer membrane protein and related peptidoglycan-associated (lipo)proteins